jgi:predicted CXXCH cytochrome family protein
MRRAVLIVHTLAALFLAAAVTPAGADDTCVACHQELPEPLGPPVEGMKQDVHAKAGLSCADCHGGDPTDAGLTSMDKAKGFIGKPDSVQIPTFCGRCHADESYMRRFDPRLPTDQLSTYWTSVHGQRLKQADTKVATCISCHGVHGILPSSDARSPVYKMNVPETCAHCHADAEYMSAYHIPTNQFAQYQRSVHGQVLLVQRDVAAPACNDCHGNHGAYPPGARSVAAVCGQCHVFNKDLFLASPHHAAFDRLALPECMTCHGNHFVMRASDEMIGVGSTAICVSCHAPDSRGYEAAERMRVAIDQLKGVISAAEETLARASAVGMEVSEAEVSLQSAREDLVKTRTQVHSFDPAALVKISDGGVQTATAAERTGEDALVQLGNRAWMALIPLGMIAALAVAVYLKIRSLEEQGPKTPPR